MIFVDMDGVLSDWEGHLEHLSPGASKEPNWRKYSVINKDIFTFYYFMPAIENAGLFMDELVKEYGTNNLAICSAVGTNSPDIVRAAKLAWLQKYGILRRVGGKVHLPLHSKEKANYIRLGRHDILIDDRLKSITPWREAGGLGILHTEFLSTLKELKELV